MLATVIYFMLQFNKKPKKVLSYHEQSNYLFVLYDNGI